MTIDLRTGKQYAPLPTDYCTKIAGSRYDADGDCPLWDKFLDRVTRSDTELQAYLQRMCGYFLSGHVYEHALFFLYGSGANGKGTFVSTTAGIMGDYAVAAPMETFIESRFDRHPTELAMLRGARLVTASETQAGRHWNEARLKQLTGGDKITARFMRGDFFEFTPQFKLLISGNHRPSLRHVDEAIRRRFHLIPFTFKIPKAERDRHLGEKLKAEWPAILAWMVRGNAEWRRIGLAPCQAVLDATADYLAQEDALAEWLAECCTLDGDGWELSSDLFASWKRWAERTGEPIGTQKAFSENLEARRTDDDRPLFRKGRQGGTGKAMFAGIRLIRDGPSDGY